MRYELKSIGLWAFVKVSFFLHLILGFIIGLLYALFFGVIMTILRSLPGMPTTDFDVKNLPIGLMVILLPIMFAILGAFFNTIFGAIIVFIYNAIAKLVGGFEFDVQPLPEMISQVPPSTTYTSQAYPQQPVAPPPPYRPAPPQPPAPPADETPPPAGL